ncbi:thermonuclease family protein [Tateyamaria omphalii]|uniref:Nuclease n=1 Tax=Tateyamaria omphalii TaxID=299262 RepID=A0A1P8MSC2_9RHOB|nr:thermonuclease family protein [Tateyamaria omphalii]APX10976.1 nuclease [Tateyamaria omphalii]
MLRLCSILVLFLFPAFASAELRGVVRVIDADTVDVGDVRVRLHAIDAPETNQSCEAEHGFAFACGVWATGQVKDRFEGRVARCVRRDTDRYGRVVASCAVGGTDMGQVIVRAGWAFAYRHYGMEYDLDEKAAFAAGQGLHGVRVQSPADFRKTRVNRRIPLDTACRIKGNISTRGQIFHVPRQEFYDRTGINERRGERWFCSEAEAILAGWRAARR